MFSTLWQKSREVAQPGFGQRSRLEEEAMRVHLRRRATKLLAQILDAPRVAAAPGSRFAAVPRSWPAPISSLLRGLAPGARATRPRRLLHRAVKICPILLVLTLLALGPLPAQSIAAGSIQASGNASISVKPDQATITAGVVTQAATAADAATQNAAMTDAMLKALSAKLGTSGTIQTIYYSLSPRYSSGSTNQPPQIIGYTATNTVQVVTNDLSLIGPLIDAANQAGGNNIGGPIFGLQNPDPVLQQALTAASKQALAHAAAIASGIGAKVGSVISAQEGTSVTPIVTGAPMTAAGTPIQTGTVNVSATVTVSVAMLQ